MSMASWREAEDDVSGARRDGSTEAAAANGKTVITKPPPPPPSSSTSSSSWLRSKDPRIVRVSRAFGGKDRHSKVSTLRGLRDRRVRLSVPTAIQVYDLQERLGVDQPSKVVDWLLDAAKDEIDELPPLPISPENFTLFPHHHHRQHQQLILNLNPGLGTSQEPGQLGFKIGGDDDSTTLANHEDEEQDRGREEENNERGKNDVGLVSNTHHHHHVGPSYGSYYNMEQHHHHSGFQTEHHQNHNLVPFPSQILVCPTTNATTQSLFPSPMEMMDPRQMVSQFQLPASSRNVSALYSLIHGFGAHNARMPVQFNQADTSAANANANANAGNVPTILGSESSTSGGSDHPN